MSAEPLKLFPIMCSRDGHRTWIPWSVIAPHNPQAQANHDQTLERLSERGGLSPCEAVAVIEDRPWRQMDDQAARLRLGELVADALDRSALGDTGRATPASLSSLIAQMDAGKNYSHGECGEALNCRLCPAWKALRVALHAASHRPAATGDVDMDRWEPAPVPLGDGRHDIGDDVRAAIVQRLMDDWSRDPDLSPQKVRELAMWAAASVRALMHELGTLRDLTEHTPDVAAVRAPSGEGRELAEKGKADGNS